MRFVTFVHEAQERFGLLKDGKIADLGADTTWAEPLDHIPGSLLELLRTEVDISQLDFSRNASEFAVEDITLCAPVPRPGKLLALAGNYSDHLKESGHEWAEKGVTTPRVFMKPQTCITGPMDPILYPPNAAKIDWECELAVVIGRTARFVKAAEALDYVAGYTVTNDVSERSLNHGVDRQARDGDKWFDWMCGKWFDSFAPMGPSLVMKDEIADPQNLEMKLWVGGELKQSGNTSGMIFSIADLIEWISRWMTLEPGDIISTGTVAGVGSASGTYLSPGDVVEVEIEQIGRLRNCVVELGVDE